MSTAPIQFAWQNPNKLFLQVRTMLLAQNTRIARVPEAAIRNAAFELQSRIKTALPKKTTALTKSVSVKFDRPAPGVLQARIGSHMAYAAYVEYGTGVFGPKGKPIVIVAKNKKALFWGVRQAFATRLRDGAAMYRTGATKSGLTTRASLGNQMVCRKRVTIQGMKPRPVYAQQTAAFMPRYTDIIRRELAKEGTA